MEKKLINDIDEEISTALTITKSDVPRMVLEKYQEIIKNPEIQINHDSKIGFILYLKYSLDKLDFKIDASLEEVTFWASTRNNKYSFSELEKYLTEFQVYFVASKLGNPNIIVSTKKIKLRLYEPIKWDISNESIMETRTALSMYIRSLNPMNNYRCILTYREKKQLEILQEYSEVQKWHPKKQNLDELHNFGKKKCPNKPELYALFRSQFDGTDCTCSVVISNKLENN